MRTNLISEELFASFRDTGHDLFLTGAVSSHGGNMSVRIGDRILITRSGSMLGRLTRKDILETGIEACPEDEGCSRELVVHRAIYQATDAQAICHAHTVHTIHRSLGCDVIVPLDSESKAILGDVPVVTAAQTIASAEAAEVLSAALREGKIAVLRTHGPFAKGATLEEAFYHVSCLEASAHILDMRDSSHAQV
ncbi:MAG: class II aldolase/adducin family protein [Coriobacteriia bacterium]|nr:class II aldolase/adducin family protein [Coriobacteriia bacterium]